MARKKFQLDFDGLDYYLEKLKSLEADIEPVVEDALKKSAEYVTEQADVAIAKHDLTGATHESLVKNAEVKWMGTTAEIKVGFDISNGGLASIFLMYGTPTMKPDKNLYSAIYGAKTKKAVKELQEKAFYEAMQEAMR